MNKSLKISEPLSILKVFILLLDFLVAILLAILLYFSTFYPIYQNNSSYANGIKDNNEIINRYQLNISYDKNKDQSYYQNIILNFLDDYKQDVFEYYDNNLENKDVIQSDTTEYLFNVVILGLPFEATNDNHISSDGYYQYIQQNDGNYAYDIIGVTVDSDLDKDEKLFYQQEMYSKLAICENILYQLNINNYKTNKDYANNLNIISYTISGVISFVIYFMIIPLFFKNGETPISKLFNVGLINNKTGFKIKKYQVFLRYFIYSPFLILGLYFLNIYSIIIFMIVPIILDIFVLFLSKDQRDIFDYVVKSKVVNVKDSYIFKDENEELRFFEKYPELEKETRNDELSYTEKLKSAKTFETNKSDLDGRKKQ